MGALRASRTAATAVVGAVLLVVLLVTWAASIGPDAVLRGDGVAPQRVETTQASPTVSESPRIGDTERVRQRRPDGVPGWVRAIAIAVEVAAGLGLLFLLHRLLRWLRETYDARRRRDPRPESVDFEVVGAPETVAREILRDAAEQRRLLDEGAPGNAIVECWHRFETQAAAAGVARREWETSAEFTIRILELVVADSRAVSRLAGLYREARFSVHEMTEADREAAVASLEEIHRGLAPVPGGAR